ncbi:hypothetical protein ACO0RG_000171 [Hanseniaspora osmophila]
MSKQESLPTHTLYIHNLNWKIEHGKLRENLYLIFSTYGEVLNIYMNHKLREQAFITFKSVDEANFAKISLNKEMFFGKPLHIEYSKIKNEGAT